MAIKRKSIDPNLISDLVAGSANQQVGGGSPKTDDPNFPVFRTPLEKDLIVYFPKNCTVTTVDGQEVYNPLVSHAHSIRKGAKQFLTYRCIAGLSGGAFDSIGYDGSCPFCDGMASCWDLYNAKMARKAQEMGIDLQNDTADQMKPYRQQFVQEMAIKKSEEYVTFPIVIISDTGTIPQGAVDESKLEPQFVCMKKDTFIKKIMDPLTKQPIPIAHPGGMFYKWCFTYDTKGKQANVRDAAKEAQYLPIVDATSAQMLSAFVAPCENRAKDFTPQKAAEVVVMDEFFDMEFLKSECDAALAETLRTLSVLNAAPAVGAPALPGGATAAIPGVGAGVQAALASFGGGAEATAQAAPAPAQAAPAQGGVPTGFAGFGA